MEPKFIAQGLMAFWRKESAKDASMAPLMSFLQYNYQERHVALCVRLGIKPLSFGKWLSKPIESITS